MHLMQLKEKLDTGKFAVLAELEPPKGTDTAEMVESAIKVKNAVDAFVVPEMSNAVMRMSALGAAMVLQARGVETVMQVCCRDRNRIALQADLLAASACGVTNIMAVTGKDPSFGDHHEARAIYDISLFELLDGIQRLQQGKDMAGIELAGAPRFLVGSSVNAGAPGISPEVEMEEMKRKIESGTRFFITPPIFDLSGLDPFLKRFDQKQVHIIPTVLLLKSLGMARYIERNVETIYIPETLINRIQSTSDRVRECVRIARELVAALKAAGFSGVVLSTLGWEEKLPEILERV
jgi:methylenetetrahydrofolate reductase (NADPH)